jgi:hypothetical protein
MAKQKVVLYSKYHVQPSLESWQWRCSKMRILSLNLVKTELWACNKYFSHPSFLYFSSWNPAIKLKLGWQIGRRLLITTRLDQSVHVLRGPMSVLVDSLDVTYEPHPRFLSAGSHTERWWRWVLHLIQAFQCTLDMSATPDPKISSVH